MTIGRNLVCSKGERDGVLIQYRTKPQSLLFRSDFATLLDESETNAIKKHYTKVVEAYASLGVLKMYVDASYSFCYVFVVTGVGSVGKIMNTDVYRITSCSFIPLQPPSECDSRINDLQKLIMSGCFYFTDITDEEDVYELSLNAQKQYLKKQADPRFFWNYSMHTHLKKFGIDTSQWFVRIMCGGVEIRTIYVGACQARACLISRLSGERAGTRFNVRGTNDDGHVANFVETEQLIVVDNEMHSSFVQTRGSVPLFWEQTGVQVGSHRVRMSRGYETSSAAFDRHMNGLKHLYGYQLLVNLLGRKEGEANLSTAYKDHLKDSSHAFDTHMIAFDYHSHCGGGRTQNLRILMDKARPSLDNFQFFSLKQNEVVSTQVGTVRTNCIDCLDRTNAVQTAIGLDVLKKQLESLGLNESRFEEAVKCLWQMNGDQISRMYSGTGAMEAGTKGTIGSKLHDGAISVKRTLKNNFFDGSKQEAIDILLLGNSFIGETGERARALLGRSYLHVTPSIMRDICQQHNRFTEKHKLRVAMATWNVNGGKHFRSIAYKHQSMHDWLLDYHKLSPEGVLDSEETFEKPVDVFAIGFEELVDLNTSNIISTSSNQKREWGSKLQHIVSRDQPYVLVTAEQLVGVCLFVFVRLQHVPYLRDVAVSTVKTGLKGKTGNKGAVSIRMLFHSTSLCFVCAHFAAGQSNVAERNRDFTDISRRMAFPMGTSIGLHDYVFWCGDFNYRIDLSNEQVKEIVKQRDYPSLLACDQLLMQKAENKVFNGFNEGTINFDPTYKYDLFSNDYDTSEKQRTPAWTDRVLWCRKNHTKHNEEEEDIPPSWRMNDENEVYDQGCIVYYGRAEMKTSDHRPVIGVIDIEVEQTIPKKLQEVHNSVVEGMGPSDPTVVVELLFDDQEVEVDLEQLLDLLDDYGNVIMLRLTDNRFYATYDAGTSANEALELGGRQLDSGTLKMYLSSSNIYERVDESFLSLLDDSTALQNEDRQRRMSEMLTATLGRQNSILEPEKLNEQTDFLDDIQDDDEENDETFDEEDELNEQQKETLKKQRMLEMDSDDEEVVLTTKPTKPLQPSKTSRPPARPTPAKTNRPLAPSRPPARPPVVKKEVAVKPSDRPQPAEFKPPSSAEVRPPSSAEVKAPNRPPRRPPSTPSRPLSTPSRPPPATSTTEKATDDGVSNPYNIQHLMHVGANNVDEFIAKMSSQLAMTKPVEKSNFKKSLRATKKGKPDKKDIGPVLSCEKLTEGNIPAKPVNNAPLPPSKPPPPRPSNVKKSQSADNITSVANDAPAIERKAPPARPKARPVTMNVEELDGIQNVEDMYSKVDKSAVNIESAKTAKMTPPPTPPVHTKPKLNPPTHNEELSEMRSEIPTKPSPEPPAKPSPEPPAKPSPEPPAKPSPEPPAKPGPEPPALIKPSLPNRTASRKKVGMPPVDVTKVERDLHEKPPLPVRRDTVSKPPLPKRTDRQNDTNPTDVVQKPPKRDVAEKPELPKRSEELMENNDKPTKGSTPPPLPKRSDLKIPPPLPTR